ncbi:MAG: ACP S-malonyltransferase [Candidatus Omnitrophica bacterium]|nr:ACP S-malonyltransferase [Candidatus Omnitrophota bacterium]MBU1128966.1 ACP S-malonyltransferase [Candidatus Omnitrophota bacterium]MBU1784689.1 ACP S-malonyltransferase [Candidatus Omnitrophota bacterium]MBU1850939.1 ACP S-malonyltransferase [Candidatus Omnitrophota bacterium]
MVNGEKLKKKFGLLFPGQGSQHAGMGKELYEARPAARWVFDRADEMLEKDLKKLCFRGPEDELMSTANSQLAIFVTSIATLNALAEKVKGTPVGNPDAEIFSPEDINAVGGVALGLSLGEPTALVAAGAMSFEDGLKFVKYRGQFMEEACRKEEGKMASIIGLEMDKVEELCNGVGVQVANLNCPGQVVISGPAPAVELAADLAKRRGAKRVIILKVGGAFHSRLMLPAKEKLKVVLEEIEIKEPQTDFISNIDAKITRDPSKIKENLANQLDSKTLWDASVRNAISGGFTDFLEIGPGNVLKGLLRKIDKSLNVMTLHVPEDIDMFVEKNISGE